VAPSLRLLLRIATNDRDSGIPLSSKFGANWDEVPDLLLLAQELKLQVVGVSFHVGSNCRNPQSFAKAIRKARSVFALNSRHERLRHNLHVLNIGGGFPIDGDHGCFFADFADVIRREMSDCFDQDVMLMAEPGRFLVSNSHILVTEVIAQRDRRDRTDYFIGDGVYGSFGDALSINQRYEPHSLLSTSSLQLPVDCRVRGNLFGPTCDAIDVIAKDVLLPKAEVGDWLYFKNMGAYTRSISSAFNGFSPPNCHFLGTSHHRAVTAQRHTQAANVD